MTETHSEPSGGEPEPEPDFKNEGALDPHEQYARLRSQCPVAQVAQPSGMRPYLITRYRDAKAALADARLSKDPRTGRRALEQAGLGPVYFEGRASMAHHMLASDPPNHTRLRKAVGAQFTQRRITRLAPQIQRITDELIDAFDQDGQAELIHAFANQLPSLVIAELLGVPAADRELFRSWSQDTLLPFHRPEQRTALDALDEYLAAAIERKRAQPGGDLLSALVAGEDEERLTAQEVVGSAVLLLLAGHETTVNLIGNGLLALLTHRDQLELLLKRPELIPNAVEEFLRFDGPVERATLRFAADDIEIGDRVIPEGSIVYVALNSANRDVEAFGDPDRLDVTRDPRGHLAFGHGLHFCLGAALARLEGKIAFETVLRRLPDLELAVAPDRLAYRSSTIMRGLAALPVRFGPRPTSPGLRPDTLPTGS
jgi:cytochrome P450